MLHPFAIPVLLSALGVFQDPEPVRLRTDAADAERAAARSADDEEVPVEDAPLAEHRARLLDLAFEAVSAMPTVPHAKNRARAQEKVVSACLELDQVERAAAFAEQIDNWRGGTSLADCAYASARRGARAEAERFLDLAASIAADPKATSEQEWRSDRIRARIAKVHWYLGDGRRGLELEVGLADSEQRELAESRAANLAAADLESWLVQLEGVVQVLSFDQTRSALDVLGHLYGRFYHEQAARDRIEGELKSLWKNLPVQVRIELMMQLASTALDADDAGNALRLVEDSLDMIEQTPWRLEDRIPVQARLAELRHRAGDARRARTELDACLALFDSDPNAIVNVYRADALRPVAEALYAVGDEARARAVYLRALEAGVENPNAWPRSEDLAETCCSMAVLGFEPDEQTWKRILEIRALLAEPW